MPICLTCGAVIDAADCYEKHGEIYCDGCTIINVGTEREAVICDTCADSMANNGEIIMCEACGEYWSVDMLHDEELDEENTFTPCPACHCDIVEGMTREEMMEEMI